MSVTIPADYKDYYYVNIKYRRAMVVAIIKEKDIQHAPQPLGKPYYFWDKELLFYEKSLPVTLTFNAEQGQSIIERDGYLMQTKFLKNCTGINEKWLYFTFKRSQYDDIMEKNKKNYPDDKIKFEFSYDVEKDLKVVKYYYPTYKNKKTMFPAEYNRLDNPEDYSFSWKMLNTYMMEIPHKSNFISLELVLKAYVKNIKTLAQPFGKEYYFWDCDMVNEKCSIFEEPLSIMLSFHTDHNDNCKICYLNAKPCEEAVKTPALLHHTMHQDDIILMYVTFASNKFREDIMSQSKADLNYMMVSFEKEPNPTIERMHLLDDDDIVMYQRCIAK